MDDETTHELDALLADGKVSGPEADAIFDRVYAAVSRDERRRPVRIVAWAFGAAAACALLAVSWNVASTPAAELRARGTVDARPVLEVSCADGSLAACPQSSKLVFLVSGDDTRGALSAYAEPLDGQGERVVYFSREVGSPTFTASSSGTRVFDRAVKLEGTHSPGRYRIHAFLADDPLERDELINGPHDRSVRTTLSIDLRVIGD